jgi:hypothetical protein
MRELIQLSIDDSTHPTALEPSGIDLGKLPCEMNAYIELRDNPVFACTSGNLKIV